MYNLNHIFKLYNLKHILFTNNVGAKIIKAMKKRLNLDFSK